MADEKDIAEPDATAGKSKTKLIVVIGGVALLLVIGAAAAFFLLGGDGDGAAGTEAAETTEPAADEGDPVYYKLNPTFVVNLPPGGSVKMLQVAVEVLTRSQTVVDALQANDPMIRHHLLNLMEEQSADVLMTVAGKQALQQAIHDKLTEQLTSLNAVGRINGVFFTQFVMQ